MPDHKGCFSSASSASISISFNILQPSLQTHNSQLQPHFNLNLTNLTTFNSHSNSYITTFNSHSHSNITTFAMAATKITTSAPSFPIPYGRSGYNKDGDDDEEDKCVNQGRSGYNGPAKAEDDEDN